jgi:DNA-binding response OmpR family regulator
VTRARPSPARVGLTGRNRLAAVRVLLVEDDRRFATALMVALRRDGYDVDHVRTAAEAVSAPNYDLVLLDLTLPDEDGVAVCRRVRETSDVGVIMLTARSEERDRVIGLRCGADDYMVKPFGLAELRARMEAVLRRARPRPVGDRVVGQVRLDLDRREAYARGERVTLTRKEFALLAILTEQPGVVVRRERLLAEVWRTTWPGTAHTLDVHVATLRSKLGDAALIQTVRGVGYRVVGEP